MKKTTMKKLFIIVTITMVTTVTGNADAQSIEQLVEQLILDKEKLTSLKANLQQMDNGYTLLKNGYTNVRNIAKGTFSLHKAYLDALLLVSPAVRNDPRIATIINAEYGIVAGYHAANARWSGSGVFTPQELSYIIDLYSMLLQRCMQSIEELTMVLTADQLRMSDGQRMQAIGRIDADTKQQLAILQQLDNNLSLQTEQRLKEQGDINTLESIYATPH
jgi:hypothetical protein